MTIGGRTFEIVIASDITRDGLGVELSETTSDGVGPIAEVFRREVDASFSFTAYEEDIPLAAIEYLIEQARDILLPA